MIGHLYLKIPFIFDGCLSFRSVAFWIVSAYIFFIAQTVQEWLAYWDEIADDFLDYCYMQTAVPIVTSKIAYNNLCLKKFIFPPILHGYLNIYQAYYRFNI